MKKTIYSLIILLIFFTSGCESLARWWDATDLGAIVIHNSGDELDLLTKGDCYTTNSWPNMAYGCDKAIFMGDWDGGGNIDVLEKITLYDDNEELELTRSNGKTETIDLSNVEYSIYSKCWNQDEQGNLEDSYICD